MRGLLGETRVHVLHPGHAVVLDDEPAGSTFSLLALHGGCQASTSRDARWQLRDADLAAGSALGVSNETSSVRDVATRVAVRDGVLTVVIP